MSEGKDTNQDFDDADDRLFNGKPLSEVDPDEVVSVEGEIEDGFETPVEEPKPDAQQQQTEAQPAAEPEDEGLPPAALAAIKDERKKRQALRDELNQLKGRLEAQPAPQQQQQRQNQPQIPNPQTDPAGYHNFMQSSIGQQIQAMEASNRLQSSRMFATQQHGAELVTAAEQAFHGMQQANPTQYQALQQAFGTSPDPIGEVVRWHKQQTLLSEIGDDPEAYKLKLKEQLMAEMGANPGQQGVPTPQNTTPNTPPRIANTPGVLPGGGAQHTMEDADSNLWGR